MRSPGAGNLRFFFGSDRYSEDLDVEGVPVHELRDKVMGVLGSSPLVATARTYGVERIVPPDISRAKQTETVQRFKIHLLTTAGEDLSTRKGRRFRYLPLLESEPGLDFDLARRWASRVPSAEIRACVRRRLEELAERSGHSSRKQ